MKTIKITRTMPAAYAMEINQHGSKTYGEWCLAEVQRIGGDATFVQEFRHPVSGKKVAKNNKNAQMWCRVERVAE